MRTSWVKTNINQLIKQLGGVEQTAAKLYISPRWVYYLAKGQKKAGYHLANEIKRLLNENPQS